MGGGGLSAAPHRVKSIKRPLSALAGLCPIVLAALSAGLTKSTGAWHVENGVKAGLVTLGSRGELGKAP
jgi:hypothetical protein